MISRIETIDAEDEGETMKTRTATAAVLAVLFACSTARADDAEGMKTLEAEGWTVPGIELEMKLIPAGDFTMGSPKSEAHRRDDEVQHKVEISKPFYMGVYEVAQGQFYKLMMPKDYDYKAWQYKRGPVADGAAYHFRPRPHGIMFNDSSLGGPVQLEHPMECISWERSREFCRKITETERKAGRLPEDYVYRLPTEAEWEYACRAGTKGPYNVDIDHTNIKDLKKIAFYSAESNWWTTRTSKCGDHRLPNAWGLYDMHGNVYEWCLDWYGAYPSASSPQADPTGPAEGKEKVVRGGCFYLDDDNAHMFLRSASRYSVPPDVDFYGIVGMRLVLAPKVAVHGSDPGSGHSTTRPQPHRSAHPSTAPEKDRT